MITHHAITSCSYTPSANSTLRLRVIYLPTVLIRHYFRLSNLQKLWQFFISQMCQTPATELALGADFQVYIFDFYRF